MGANHWGGKIAGPTAKLNDLWIHKATAGPTKSINLGTISSRPCSGKVNYVDPDPDHTV